MVINIDALLAFRMFGLLIVSLFVYWRILDIKNISKTKFAAAFLFAFVMSIPLSFAPPFYELLFLGSVLGFVAVTARVKISLMIPCVIISVGTSLGICGLAIFFVLLTEIIYFIITGIYFINIISQGILSAVTFVLEVIIQAITIVFASHLFKKERLKKGIIFLENKEAVRIGIVFGILIMINWSILPLLERIYSEIVVSSPIFFITIFFITIFVSCVCTVGLYFWWRQHTTSLYQQRLKQRELEQSDIRINELTKSNDFLSKAVHRDNKLIPAMYNAVNRYLSETAHNVPKGTAILEALGEIMQERKDMIMQIQREYKSLPQTGIERIDSIINYMLSKATENDIEFDFAAAKNIQESIQEVVDNIISKSQLETLLADLIENAVIATSDSAYKRVRVTMGEVDDCFELCVYDSGATFETETLNKLGKEKITTHADTGGSGVGYMTVFEILKERNASIDIVEYTPEDYAFTKCVRVRFDGKREQHHICD